MPSHTDPHGETRVARLRATQCGLNEDANLKFTNYYWYVHDRVLAYILKIQVSFSKNTCFPQRWFLLSSHLHDFRINPSNSIVWVFEKRRYLNFSTSVLPYCATKDYTNSERKEQSYSVLHCHIYMRFLLRDTLRDRELCRCDLWLTWCYYYITSQLIKNIHNLTVWFSRLFVF